MAVLATPRARRAGGRRGAALVGVLVWWQWAPIVREYLKVGDDPSVEASYYEPLLGFLAEQRGPPARVTIPQLRSQWESYYVAKEHPSGRGWLRQVDVELNPLFYEGRSTRALPPLAGRERRRAGSRSPMRRSATAATTRSS